MSSFKTFSDRISKFSSVIKRLEELQKLPDDFDIPDDIIDSSSVSELVDYVISKYYA